MGTDIHTVFQKKVGAAGRWVDIPNPYEENRDYLLFAWLADVRNGYGFAGVVTHTPIQPIAKPRDLPEDFEMGVYEDGFFDDTQHPIGGLDIMPPYRQKYHTDDETLSVWMGDHSWSWLLGSEVLAADTQIIERTGIVPIGFFKTWDGKTAPVSWCGGVSGPGILVSHPDTITAKTTDVIITWKEDTKETLAYFIDMVRKLMEEHGEIRIVFGFDS
jgi:hypothetical protein